MNVSYAIEQIAGPKLKSPLVNQGRNLGGDCVAVTAEIFRTDGSHYVTLPTFESMAEIEDRLEKSLTAIHAY